MNKSKNERSQQDITFALIYLLGIKKYENISVTDICEKAMISRKTFYNHFQEKNDILKYYLSKLIDKFVTNTLTQNMSFMNLMETVFNVLNGHRQLLKSFYDNNLLRFSAQIYINYLKDIKKIFHFKIDFNDDWHLRYLPSLIVLNMCDIILIWIENDFKETPSELAHLTQEYYQGTLLVD